MSNNKPFITIITPTYNRANLIWCAIDSIINQKTTIPFDWEMIIVDDGSTDNTKEIIEKYIKKYSKNIFYFWQRNSWIPGVARNVWLDNMNKKSDYLIFLDSDDELVGDCVCTCLGKWEKIKKKWYYEKVFSLSYFCKDQFWNNIWNKKIFNKKKEKKYTYEMYLSRVIHFELHSILKSSIFLKFSDFRFPEDVITESVLWAKIFKFFNQQWWYVLLLDYIWRIYRIESWSNQITKSINPERFRKNAIGNERLLEIISEDLIKFWYKKSYAEYFFRAWINWILYGDRKRWLQFIKKSLKYYFNIKVFLLYLLSMICRPLVLFIYKLYI